MTNFWVRSMHFHISDLYMDIISVNDNIRLLLLLRILLLEVNAKDLRLSQDGRLVLSNHASIAHNHFLSTVLNFRESFQYICGNIIPLKAQFYLNRLYKYHSFWNPNAPKDLAMSS